jgi:hypothetical protein
LTDAWTAAGDGTERNQPVRPRRARPFSDKTGHLIDSQMTYSGKIVLLSTTGYVPERDDGFLCDLFAARIELFCVLGVDADKWEDALDWTCIGENGMGDYVITTTSHTDESLAEVTEFAERFNTRAEHVVQVVRR